MTVIKRTAKWRVYDEKLDRFHHISPENFSYYSVEFGSDNFELYSGYIDLNDTPIYEGDIVKLNGQIVAVKWFRDLNWDSGGSTHPGLYFDFEWLRDTHELSYHDSFDDEEIEVIGNIHQNEDLLIKEGNNS